MLEEHLAFVGQDVPAAVKHTGLRCSRVVPLGEGAGPFESIGRPGVSPANRLRVPSQVHCSHLRKEECDQDSSSDSVPNRHAQSPQHPLVFYFRSCQEKRIESAALVPHHPATRLVDLSRPLQIPLEDAGTTSARCLASSSHRYVLENAPRPHPAVLITHRYQGLCT